MKFKVLGTQRVGDVEPGGIVDLDLPEANIDALIRCGNIEAGADYYQAHKDDPDEWGDPVPPPKKTKAIESKGGE